MLRKIALAISSLSLFIGQYNKQRYDHNGIMEMFVKRRCVSMYRVFAKSKLVWDVRQEVKVSLLNLYKKKAATAAPRPANAGTWIIWAAPVACSRELEVAEGPELAAASESEAVAVADPETTEVMVERDAVTEALPADTDAAADALGSG